MAQMVKNRPAMWEIWIWSLGWEDPLEEGMATHSSIPARRIPMDRGAWWGTVHGVQTVRHNWVTKHSTAHTPITGSITKCKEECRKLPEWFYSLRLDCGLLGELRTCYHRNTVSSQNSLMQIVVIFFAPISGSPWDFLWKTSLKLLDSFCLQAQRARENHLGVHFPPRTPLAKVFPTQYKSL